MSKARSENLSDRLNDMSDVHQDELLTIKQVLYFCVLFVITYRAIANLKKLEMLGN